MPRSQRCRYPSASLPSVLISLLRVQHRVDFARDVLPIFRQNCFSCHGASQQINGLRMDRRVPSWLWVPVVCCPVAARIASFTSD